jgi:hypothetical protein
VNHTLFTLHQLAADRDAAVKEKQRLTDQLAKVRYNGVDTPLSWQRVSAVSVQVVECCCSGWCL